MRSKHGYCRRRYRSPEYSSWMAMRTRCTNPKTIHYDCYGGRGIKVCDRWERSFVAFLEDMGPRPSLQHTLDRIDTNKDYEPGNCRWATKKEQSRNRRDNNLIEYKGECRCLTEWAEVLKIDYEMIRCRLRLGWDFTQAVETYQDGTNPGHRMIEYKNETRCMRDWARHFGMTHELLRSRLRLGWDFERAVTTPKMENYSHGLRKK